MGLQCGICYEPYDEPVSVPCGHIFCSGCLAKTFEEHEDYEVPCPSCRTPFPTISLDLHMVPRKLRAHVTPCIRKIFLDDASETSQAQVIESLEAQLRAEKLKNTELEQEKEMLSKELDSLYRIVNVYKSREKELETKDRRQKFQVANQVDELMHDNQRLQTRLEEAQALLTNMGLGRRTPPPSVPRAGPSTPRATEISARPSIFSTPSTPRTLTFAHAPISPFKGGLAVAREDLQARMRVSTMGSPTKMKLGEKRQREPQDDIDMLANSDTDKDDPDMTLTPGGSKRPPRTPGLLGRSVRRKYGVQ